MDQGVMGGGGAATGSAASAEPPSLLPQQAPRAMPDQVLWPIRSRTQVPRLVRIARLALAVLWVGATAAFAWTLYRVLSVETPTPLQIVFLILSTLCFAWVAVGSVTSVIGVAALLADGRADNIGLIETPPSSGARTALLFPVYQEHPAAIVSTIDVLCRELVAGGAMADYDVFVLSDTQDSGHRAIEERAYAELNERWRSAVRVYARWRSPNAGKKAGNIRDWIERFGGGYGYFVVLDADSTMSAAALQRLVATMDEHPRAGLIQTVPRLTGAVTLFGHLKQYASNCYGTVLAAGLARWHGPGGNYWGHNAIVRTEAFAESAGLPELPGRPPLGGHILSHDFVEAALLRRAGWDVHLAPSLDSFEGSPPTLADLIVRDRRWAQGNLQHLRLLSTRGLPLLSRVHLLMGALSYCASPAWAVTLLVGVVLAFQATHATPTYFGKEASLFPRWPVFDAETALALFIATLLVVHLPKLLGFAWALIGSTEQRRHALRLAGGLLLESVFSTLIAPALMVSQTGAVLSVLLGRDAGWGAQRRAAGSVSVLDRVPAYRWHLTWGIAGTVLTAWISVPVLLWMSPILLGLLLAPVLDSVTGRVAPEHIGRLLTVPVKQEADTTYRAERA